MPVVPDKIPVVNGQEGVIFFNGKPTPFRIEVVVKPESLIEEKQQRETKMKYPQFIKRLAHTAGLSEKQAHEFMRLAADLIGSAIINEGEIHLPGVGKFTRVERKARQGRNPKTGETITIPAHCVVKFKTAAAITDALHAQEGK